jgi:hypothetical protein
VPPLVPVPTSRYDNFLFAPIYEEANGMQLSVLSALTRMNVDPWDEAARLAAMPKAIAEKALGATFDRISGGRWSQPEMDKVAVRLVRLLPGELGRLLPQEDKGAATGLAAVRAQRTSYWLVWVGIFLAMSFLATRFHATTTDADVSASTSDAASPPASAGVNGTHSGTSEKSN